jgi:hypothetical protein
VNREEKINAIQGLLSGQKMKRPVKLLELKEYSSKPGIYIGIKGQVYNEVDRSNLIKQAKESSALVWEEIKTYR